MITCIGNPVYDYIETPEVKPKGRILSGCSTNASIVMRKLGMETTLVGSVGREFLDDFKNQMKAMDIAYHINESEKSGGFGLTYHDNGDRDLEVLGIANKIEAVPKEILSSEAIMLGPILQEIAFDLEWLREQYEGMIFIDPQGFLRYIENGKILRRKNPDIERIVSICDIVKPNEYEAEVMTGINPQKNPEGALETLYSWGSEIAIITLAERGSIIFDGNEVIKIPPYRTKAVDPTGAGDTYAGGFIVEYLNKKDPYKAGLFASCTSSIMVENVGKIPVTEENVRKRVASLR
ncbi:MAG: PfkB family carbohydrate kinase [Euryarchaeota archaeon]|nr:PfkB family carbohydrate kinase [Euryarchaeota archaeon]